MGLQTIAIPKSLEPSRTAQASATSGRLFRENQLPRGVRRFLRGAGFTLGRA